MRKMTLAAVALAAFVTSAIAQTKISGTVQCAKPDEQHALDVGDRPQHSLAISKGKCTWTKPMEIAGTQTKDDSFTGFEDVSATKGSGRGYVVGTLANGDKMYVRTQSTATLKDGSMQTETGSFTFTGGTGKAKGIKGKGTYKGKPAPDGSATFDVEGEYELPK